MLTKEQILKSDDIKEETVPVPEWGGEVLVTTLTGTELNRFQSSLVKEGKTDLSDIMVKLVALCVIDYEGNRVFDDDDLIALGKKSGSAINRIFGVAQSLNKLDDKDIEELGKNSGKIQEDSSILD